MATRAASLAGIVAVLFLLMQTEWRDYLTQPPFGKTVKRYNSRDFWGRGQGLNVGRVTDSDDSVFVYGNEAEIYYYSKRRCASRYTMITGLKEGYPGSEARRKKLIDDLERDPPRLILLLFDQPPFPEWQAFLDEHYGQPVGADFHDKRTRQVIMFVLADPKRPVDSIDWNWDRTEVHGWFPDEVK